MDIKSTRQIYNDIWNYHKKYLDMRNDEKFLKSMISEKDGLLKKYSGNSFATEMMFIVIKYIDSS